MFFIKMVSHTLVETQSRNTSHQDNEPHICHTSQSPRETHGRITSHKNAETQGLSASHKKRVNQLRNTSQMSIEIHQRIRVIHILKPMKLVRVTV